MAVSKYRVWSKNACWRCFPDWRCRQKWQRKSVSGHYSVNCCSCRLWLNTIRQNVDAGTAPSPLSVSSAHQNIILSILLHTFYLLTITNTTAYLQAVNPAAATALFTDLLITCCYVTDTNYFQMDRIIISSVIPHEIFVKNWMISQADMQRNTTDCFPEYSVQYFLVKQIY